MPHLKVTFFCRCGERMELESPFRNFDEYALKADADKEELHGKARKAGWEVGPADLSYDTCPTCKRGVESHPVSLGIPGPDGSNDSCQPLRNFPAPSTSTG